VYFSMASFTVLGRAVAAYKVATQIWAREGVLRSKRRCLDSAN